MDRRSFLKRMAGMGALVATSQLPALAEDDPTLFPKRGRFERLALNYGTVNIGLEKPFSILHISDTHLTAVYPHEDEKKQQLHKIRTTTFGGRQEEALRDSLDWARQHVDYVVHTGDLIDWQSEANFDLVKKYFGEGVVGCLGNHEFSQHMWLSEPKETGTEQYKDLTRKKLQEVFPYDIELQSQVVGGVNFVTLDDVYGYVTERQVELFRKEVKKGLPIVLCMHVPFHTENIWRADIRFWHDEKSRFRNVAPDPSGEYKRQQDDPVTSAFIAYLKTEPLLKAILAGHLHITIQDQFSPTATEYVVGGNFLFHGEEILFI
ncbi:MAG: metallophosphoesterase [Bacteroidaceae bacterium]|nr:metallophosphoesterase [Bacteroidaceae bacterium]